MSAADRTIVVTGCTAGLGLHCVTSLAADPSVGTIIFACRNKVAAETTATSIISKTKCAPGKIVVLSEACDLQDNASVRRFATAVHSYLNGRKIYALVNNAGIGGSATWSKNAEGHDSIFVSNHLGHFLLTVLLLPVITDRVVNVSRCAFSCLLDDEPSRVCVPSPSPMTPFPPARCTTWTRRRRCRTRPSGGRRATPSTSHCYCRCTLSRPYPYLGPT